MYGMINDAIKSLVIELMGVEPWEGISTKVQAPAQFEKMGRYDDAITYSLVEAVCAHSQLPPEKVLETFGKYWISYAAKTSYGPMIRMFGQDLKSCIMNLDAMHDKMGSILIGLKAPQFTSQETPAGDLQVIYRSTRVGLSPMVKGLIEGLGDYYGNHVQVEKLKTMKLDAMAGGFAEESHFRVRIES